MEDYVRCVHDVSDVAHYRSTAFWVSYEGKRYFIGCMHGCPAARVYEYCKECDDLTISHKVVRLSGVLDLSMLKLEKGCEHYHEPLNVPELEINPPPLTTEVVRAGYDLSDTHPTFLKTQISSYLIKYNTGYVPYRCIVTAKISIGSGMSGGPIIWGDKIVGNTARTGIMSGNRYHTEGCCGVEIAHFINGYTGNGFYPKDRPIGYIDSPPGWEKYGAYHLNVITDRIDSNGQTLLPTCGIYRYKLNTGERLEIVPILYGYHHKALWSRRWKYGYTVAYDDHVDWVILPKPIADESIWIPKKGVVKVPGFTLRGVVSWVMCMSAKDLTLCSN